MLFAPMRVAGHTGDVVDDLDGLCFSERSQQHQESQQDSSSVRFSHRIQIISMNQHHIIENLSQQYPINTLRIYRKFSYPNFQKNNQGKTLITMFLHNISQYECFQYYFDDFLIYKFKQSLHQIQIPWPFLLPKQSFTFYHYPIDCPDIYKMGNDQIKSSIPDKEMQEGKRDGDGNTEIREIVNEWADEEHHYELQKQEQLPKISHFAYGQPQCEIDREQVPQQTTELPILSYDRNPEIREEEPKQKYRQQHQQYLQEKNREAIANIQSQDFKEIEVQLKAQETNIQIVQVQPSNQILQISQQYSKIKQFSTILKSPTISLNATSTMATQADFYWQNKKLILSEPVKNRSRAFFKVINLKYCVGMGMALKEIIQKHEYNYQSYENELSHGLFLVTSQGYSWSHAYKAEDDCFRADFKKMKNNDIIEVTFEHDNVNFTYKQASFSLSIPDSVLQKYTLCFCAYLHEKSDSIGLQLDQSEADICI